MFQLILIAGVILYESHMWHIMDVTTHTVEVSTSAVSRHVRVPYC